MFMQSQNSYAPNLEVLVGVRSSYFRTKLKDNLLPHSNSELDVPYMFFYHRDERNAIVKSVSHFDNFKKWSFFVVNNCKKKIHD
jgi:hypothetical protein